MHRFKSRRFRRRRRHLSDNDRSSSLPSSLSVSSTDSNLSVSSVLSSIRQLSINLNDRLCSNDLQAVTDLSLTRDSTKHTSLCRICHNLHSSNEHDLCRENQSVIRSNSLLATDTNPNAEGELVKSQTAPVGNVSRKHHNIHTLPQSSKQLKQQCIKRLASLHWHSRTNLRSSSSYDSSELCSPRLLLQPKLSVETEVMETKKCPLSPGIPQFLRLSPERINHYKQRQIELDRSMTKLLETLKTRTTENITQISNYWSHLKDLSLNQLQPKTNQFQLFDYLLKSTPTNKQFKLYLEENDEIQAALQILWRVLTIVRDQHSFASINELFTSVEKSTLESLHEQSECLLSSYYDELSFIHGRIHFYQSRINGEKTFDWAQCINVDYPMLIEKISDDFITKVPQIEQTLVEMLRTMKKHLLRFDIEHK